MTAEENVNNTPEKGEEEKGEEEEEEEQDILINMPEYLLERIETLKQLDRDRDEQFAEYFNERAALEAKYQVQYSKLYKERSLIVQGNKKENVCNNDDNNTSEEKVQGIPQFWVCAIAHNETLQAMLSEGDVECLESLQDVTCEDDEDGKAFTLTFTFDTNDYFENTTLMKRYEVPNLLLDDEPTLKKVAGTEIQWKEDKSLTHTTVLKKQRGKGQLAGQVRTVAKQESQESFFHWFTPPKMPDHIRDIKNEEEAADLEALFAMDYEVAQIFRTQVIPKAVHWFTGEAAQPVLDESVEELLVESSE